MVTASEESRLTQTFLGFSGSLNRACDRGFARPGSFYGRRCQKGLSLVHTHGTLDGDPTHRVYALPMRMVPTDDVPQ